MSDLQKSFDTIAQQFSGQFSLYAEHMATGEVIQYGPTHPMETASVIKLPIMITVMHLVEEGRLRLDQPVLLEPSDMVSGSGVVQNLTPGLSLTLADAVMLMMTISDNVATNMVIRLLGLEPINALMASLGARDTVIKKPIDFTLPPPIGLSTPKDLVTLLFGIYRRTTVSAKASDWMWDVLTRQQYDIVLSRDLPYSLLEEGENEPATVVIGSKSGSVEGVRNDAGIFTTPWGDYALAIMSEGCRDVRFHVDNEAQRVLPALSRAILGHFAPEALTHGD